MCKHSSEEIFLAIDSIAPFYAICSSVYFILFYFWNCLYMYGEIRGVTRLDFRNNDS